jgi:hypothetical protein
LTQPLELLLGLEFDHVTGHSLALLLAISHGDLSIYVGIESPARSIWHFRNYWHVHVSFFVDDLVPEPSQ